MKSREQNQEKRIWEHTVLSFTFLIVSGYHYGENAFGCPERSTIMQRFFLPKLVLHRKVTFVFN
jgi:hypothetical protein